MEPRELRRDWIVTDDRNPKEYRRKSDNYQRRNFFTQKCPSTKRRYQRVTTKRVTRVNSHHCVIAGIMIDRLEKEVDMLLRHFEVLGMVLENEPIGIVKMSNESGHPHHKIRYSLRVLEEEGLIEPTSQGATTTDQAREFVTELDSNVENISDQLEGMKIGDKLEVGH